MNLYLAIEIAAFPRFFPSMMFFICIHSFTTTLQLTMPPKKKTKTQKKDHVNDEIHVDDAIDDNKSSLKGKIAGKCRHVVRRHSSRVIHKLILVPPS